MTMLVVNIAEAKAKLSEFLDAVAKGERIVISKRNQPVAELRAIEPKRTEPRAIGGGPHHFPVPDAFNEPLAESDVDAFEGAPVFPKPIRQRSRVAERHPRYAAKPRR